MIGPTDLLHPSPAPHFKTFQVFLICCPKRPSFSTIQSHAQNNATYLSENVLLVVRRFRKNAGKRPLVWSCLSVRMEQLGSQWKEFHEIRYFSISRKSLEKIELSLEYEKTSTLHERPVYFFLSYLAQFF